MNNYYKTNSLSLLDSALKETEQSMRCDQMRLGAVDMKISLLILLKKYQRGYEYVDSLSLNDFKLKYKKDMCEYYFHALNCETKSDTVNMDKYYNKIISIIKNFIQSEHAHNNKFNEDAYYDLFFIKAKVSDPKRITLEIDNLKQKYPSEGDFLEGIKTTLFNVPMEVKATPH